MIAERKGQSSFEMVIIAAIVVVLTFTALSYIPRLAASTGAIGILKGEILEELSRYDRFYFVESIDSPRANTALGQTEIEVFIGGEDVNPIRSHIEEISAVIEDANFYDNVSIVVQQAAQ
ncbi:MAG: hypothetical protein J7L44_02770 [Candidatus Diapherotrites archaeon]|nr:hypothetical protein [Candidatus Diapherotrites archaeon]